MASIERNKLFFFTYVDANSTLNILFFLEKFAFTLRPSGPNTNSSVLKPAPPFAIFMQKRGVGQISYVLVILPTMYRKSKILEQCLQKSQSM